MAGEKKQLTQREKDIFDAEFDLFAGMHMAERDFSGVFNAAKEQIYEACEIAKYQLDSDFGGINARSNEFGWTEPHPNVLLGTTSRTTAIYSENTWMKTYTAANMVSLWVDWIGTSTAALKLSKYGSMILLGFADMVEVPKVHAILATIKGINYPKWNMQNAMQVPGNLHVYSLPKPIMIEKEQEMYMQVKVVHAGEDKLRPLGVYFGRGDVLRSKVEYAQV